jgi:rRNA maturation endonuclease Nob1
MPPRGRKGSYHTYNVGGVPIEDGDIVKDTLLSEDEGEPTKHHKPEMPSTEERDALGAPREPPEPGVEEAGSAEYQVKWKAGRVRCGACGAYVIPTDYNCCSMCGEELGNVTSEVEGNATIPQQRLSLKRCSECNEAFKASDAKFCPNCGASLEDSVKPEPTIITESKSNPKKRVKQEVVKSESCMVCHLAFSKDDDIVWCPYCGNSAHRNHMLEWIHIRHRCPVCNEFLEEQTLQG